MPDDPAALARVLKSELRAIERRLGTARKIAARLADALPTDTSEEDTSDENSSSPAHALHA